jgi:hypothetical protein
MITRKSHTKFAKETEVSVVKKFGRRFLSVLEEIRENKMPDVDLANRHPALQSMCSKD